MAFYKTYSLTDIITDAGFTEYTSANAISAMYSFFTDEDNTQFDCLDFLEIDGALAIANKDRAPKLTSLTSISSGVQSYVYIGAASSSSNIYFSGASTNTATSTSGSVIFGVTTTKVIFMRNDYDDCIINFYNTSTGSCKPYIFAQCSDGLFRICGIFGSSVQTSYQNLYTFYAETSYATTALVPIIDSGDENKYLVPLAVNNSIFKRVYRAVNCLHSFSVPYELDGKLYFETGQLASGYEGLALLYEE